MTLQAPVLPAEPPLSTKEEIVAYIHKRAVESKIEPSVALYVAEHESQFIPEATGDHNITCKRTGQPVYARGVWQITRCWHPEISDEDAFDVVKSTEIMLPLLRDKSSCKREWTTCRAYYEKNLDAV